MRTVVTNTSGNPRFLGYVPPHGATLANGAAAVVDGDLRTVLAGRRQRRSIAALDRAVQAGAITVVSEEDPSSSGVGD